MAKPGRGTSQLEYGSLLDEAERPTLGHEILRLLDPVPPAIRVAVFSAILAALAAHQGDQGLHHRPSVLLLAHVHARGTPSHLAVEASLAPGFAAAPPQGEDPTQGLHARVEHARAPVRA